MNAGDYPAALATYRRIEPAYQALYEMMAPVLPMGVHPFTQLKYYQWFVGGNGGLLRPPLNPVERGFKLTPEQREKIATAYGQIGIEMVGLFESFVVGRSLHASGVEVDMFDAAARDIVVPDIPTR